MKQNTKAVATITQKELNDEGIKTQLTQNDVLEIIVEEKYKELEQKFKYFDTRLQEMSKEIYTLTKEHYISLIPKFIKKYKLPFTEEQLSNCSNYMFVQLDGTRPNDRPVIWDFNSAAAMYGRLITTKVDELIVRPVSTYKDGRKTRVGLGTEFRFPASIDPALKIKVNFNHTDHKKTVVNAAIGYEVSESVSSAFSLWFHLKDVKGVSKILAEVADYKKQSLEFVEKYKEMDISYDSLLRQVKTMFNKELIKTGSPKLRAKIKESFGISI